MGLQYEKFPYIEFKGRQIIWDTRQSVKDSKSSVCIVVRPGLRQDLIEQLLSQHRVGEVVCGPNEKNGVTNVLKDVPTYVEENSDFWLAEKSAEFFDFPSRKLSLVGVTGTNGKSSCVDFLAKAAANAGKKSMLIGTLGVSVFEESGELSFSVETGFTTPEAPSLQCLLYQAWEAGVEFIAMEVSSHALELGRVHGCVFQTAILTNITQDHLDFHGTMENYAYAKGNLFREYLEGKGIVYVEDSYSKKLFDEFSKSSKQFSLVGVSPLENGKMFHENGKLHFFWNENEFVVPLRGYFNAANLRLCLEVVGSFFADMETLKVFLASYKGASGRMEEVRANVFVDYAHTPDALRSSLRSLRESLSSEEKLTVVFGCGGDRDQSKRPLMGEAAFELADFVVITNDNPRSEDPEDILQDIVGASGRRQKWESLGKLHVELDREKAIAYALDKAAANDIVLIAGKGHEAYQILNSGRIDFSDHEVVVRYRP